MRRILVLMIVATALVAISAGSVLAGATKVDVCHSEGNGSYHLINISEAAFDKHVNHGDASPDQAVPGKDGYSFDDDCVPVAGAVPVLVRAWSVDSGGADHLVAQVEDTDGSGAPSAGDTIRTDEYPQDFTGTLYGRFTITVHEVDSVGSCTATECDLSTASGDLFRFEHLAGVSEGFQEGQVFGEVSAFKDDLGLGIQEFLEASTASPSAPDANVGPFAQPDTSDNDFINVEISF